MFTTHHHRNLMILLLGAAFPTLTTPALGQPVQAVAEDQPQVPVQTPSFARSFGTALAGFGLGLAVNSMVTSSESNAGPLVLVATFAAVGYGAARGASTDQYSVGMLAPTGAALGAFALSGLVFLGGWEQDSDGLALVGLFAMLVTPPLAAAATATHLGKGKARALTAAARSVQPTLGRTPDGQLGLGLRLSLPNH